MKMEFQIVWMLSLEFTINIIGFPGIVYGNCVRVDQQNCSQYKFCTELTDPYVYPGRIKTLVKELHIPRGLTSNASINLLTISDRSVIIIDAYLEYQDDSLTMTKGVYRPRQTSSGERSTSAAYHFGDVDCGGNRDITASETDTRVSSDNTDSSDTTQTSTSSFAATAEESGDLCDDCVIKLAVEYLMCNILDVSDNSERTVTSAFVSENVTMEIASILVLQTFQNSTNESNFTTDIPDPVEFPLRSLKSFHLTALFRNPLSIYKIVLLSSNESLRIITARVDSVGEHFKGIIKPTFGPLPDDELHCEEGTDMRTIDFGYIPNKGAFDEDTSETSDIVHIEVQLLLTATDDFLLVSYSLEIYMEVDAVFVMNTTKYFIATEHIPIEKINVTQDQESLSLHIGGTGSATLTLEIPPSSHGEYHIEASTKRYGVPGGDGFDIAGIKFSNVQVNRTCKHMYFKTSKKASVNISDISYGISREYKCYFTVIVLASPSSANSTYELTLSLSYPGKGSPQSFIFYFNITNEEKVSTRLDGNLDVKLQEYCQSLTPSTKMTLRMNARPDTDYGVLLLELPVPYELGSHPFAICSFEIDHIGTNIFGGFKINMIRGIVNATGKVLVDMFPLSNILFSTKKNANSINMKMVVTFTDTAIHPDTFAKQFKARIISNNTDVWTGELAIVKPAVEYYPDFIVLTKIGKPPETIWFHYSLNGSYFHRIAIKVDNDIKGHKFENPKVVAYFHFSSNPCTPLCHIEMEWLPLKHYITVIKDDNNRLLRQIPYALDQDLNTCFDLPVPGNSPSILWLMIKDLSLFNVMSQKFVVHVTGEGIECTRVGQKTVHVGTSAPVNNQLCNIEADMVFCKLMPQSYNATATQCDFECENLQKCSNVHVVMQSATKDIWRLCELTINDML